MKMIAPQSISFTASVTEEEIRDRMGQEVLESIGGLDADGKPLPGVTVNVRRGGGRAGGYTIEVKGPAPARVVLPGPTKGGDNA